MDEATPAPTRTLEDLKREHGTPPGGRGTLPQGELLEQSPVRNYVRDLVLGYNDGLVSVFAATAGIAGAAFATDQILVAGVAISIAGALSMGAGEYISTKSQAQYYQSERRREEEHLTHWPELEQEELRESLRDRGIPPHLLDEVAQSISSDRQRLLDYMMRDEFGVGKESERSPWTAAGLITVAFLVGAAFAVFPYAFWDASRAVLASTIVSLAGLFLAGVLRARVSRLPSLSSGFEMVLVGLLAGGVTYGVGRLVGLAI